MKLWEVYLVSTRGFLEIYEETRASIMEIAIREVSPKTDFIVFDNQTTRTRQYEDQGRSIRVGMPGLSDKVYAKLDDYGDKETLSEQVGHKVNTQYVLTFMLSSEY